VDVKSILATTRTTALWVTHDHDEALVVADRTLSLSDIGS
jgi:ABC-type nitrate/sulfonate/bicarbonate transport system ATPase subunit